jgi:hypothetical protein
VYGSAVTFSTHGGRPGQTDENVQKMDRSPWDVKAAVTNIPRNAIKNEMQTKELVACLCFNEGRIFLLNENVAIPVFK